LIKTKEELGITFDEAYSVLQQQNLIWNNRNGNTVKKKETNSSKAIQKYN